MMIPREKDTNPIIKGINMNKTASNYICPTEAFQILKRAGTMGTPVYIYGFAGFGKTELVRQFFGSRKYLYFSCKNSDPDLSVIPEKTNRKAPDKRCDR